MTSYGIRQEPDNFRQQADKFMNLDLDFFILYPLSLSLAQLGKGISAAGKAGTLNFRVFEKRHKSLTAHVEGGTWRGMPKRHCLNTPRGRVSAGSSAPGNHGSAFHLDFLGSFLYQDKKHLTCSYQNLPWHATVLITLGKAATCLANPPSRLFISTFAPSWLV